MTDLSRRGFLIGVTASLVVAKSGARLLAPYFNSLPGNPSWLVCDGQVVRAADFPELFAVVGNIYGGLDGTSFRLPDYSGDFFRGEKKLVAQHNPVVAWQVMAIKAKPQQANENFPVGYVMPFAVPGELLWGTAA